MFIALIVASGVSRALAQTCTFASVTGECVNPMYCAGASIVSRLGANGCQGVEGAGFVCCIEQTCMAGGMSGRCRNEKDCGGKAFPNSAMCNGMLPAEISCCPTVSVATTTRSATVFIPTETVKPWYTLWYIWVAVGVAALVVCALFCVCCFCAARKQPHGSDASPALASNQGAVGGGYSGGGGTVVNPNFPVAALDNAIEMRPDPMLTRTMQLRHSPSVAGGIGSGLSAGLNSSGAKFRTMPAEDAEPGLYSFQQQQSEPPPGMYSTEMAGAPSPRQFNTAQMGGTIGGGGGTIGGGGTFNTAGGTMDAARASAFATSAFDLPSPPLDPTDTNSTRMMPLYD